MKAALAALLGYGRGAKARRGFALPVVLLVLAAMSVLALRMVEESRTGIAVARARLDEAVARNAADAGYEMFLTRHAALGEAFAPPAFDAAFGTTRVSVRVVSEAGKIDLNVGAQPLIEGILRVVGADPARAAGIAAGVAEFRGGGGVQIFRSVDELLRVPGMDLALLERVRPFVTVHFGAPGIDARIAPREVLLAVPEMTAEAADRIIAARATGEALDRADRTVLRAYLSRGRPVYTVWSAATLAGGASFIREAVVDLGDPTAPVVFGWRRANAAAPQIAAGAE